MQYCLLAGSGFVVFMLLPLLTSRTKIYDSLIGRLTLFKEYILASSGWCELLLGRGLGAGTNTAVSLLMDWKASDNPVVFIADSTPLMLTAQIGIIGLFLVYGILFLAARIDPQARIIYLSIILASLTVNITELFPVNFILGLLLSRSFSLMVDRNGLHLKLESSAPPA